MLSIDKYEKTRINGEVDYLLAANGIQIPSQLVNESSAETVDVDALVDYNKINVVLARYAGYSTSEDQDVYEVSCAGGLKFLTDSNGAANVLNGSLPEYVKTVLSNGNRAFVNSGNSLRVNPLQVVSIVQTKNGYNNISDAEEDANSVACYLVTMANGEKFITNSTGLNPLDTNNWC